MYLKRLRPGSSSRRHKLSIFTFAAKGCLFRSTHAGELGKVHEITLQTFMTAEGLAPKRPGFLLPNSISSVFRL